MKLIRLAAALCIALAAAACLPVTTKAPVGSSASLGADKSFYGTWMGHGEKDSSPAYIHFLNAKDGGLTIVIVSPPKGDDAGDWSVYAASTADLGGNHFLNVRTISNNGEVPGAGEMKGTFPLLYRTGKDGSVTLYMMDEDATADAIKNGKIAGERDAGKDGDVHITATAAATDAFMQSPQGVALFNKPLLTLTRVK
ncbi:MAG TPA: hypothetical protein VHW02_10145 [Rhizomicrobium sp.]|jgi:ABC-type glycerol-3-phosphate transport system substrate-binding protein|nr:hypothetical protein [Rhizomicrobium sp.]